MSSPVGRCWVWPPWKILLVDVGLAAKEGLVSGHWSWLTRKVLLVDIGVDSAQSLKCEHPSFRVSRDLQIHTPWALPLTPFAVFEGVAFHFLLPNHGTSHHLATQSQAPS